MSKEHWDDIYKKNLQLNKYPWSNVVSFYFKYREFLLIEGNSILEVGCGSGINLHPFADSKLKCLGIDFSESAVIFARNFSRNSNLDIQFHQADLNDKHLENIFKDFKFSALIDRACLSCLSFDQIKNFFYKVKPFLSKKCKIFFTPYSIDDSSCFPKEIGFKKPKSNSYFGEISEVMYFDKNLIYNLAEELSFTVIDLIHNTSEKIVSSSSDEIEKVSFYEVIMES